MYHVPSCAASRCLWFIGEICTLMNNILLYGALFQCVHSQRRDNTRSHDAGSADGRRVGGGGRPAGRLKQISLGKNHLMLLCSEQAFNHKHIKDTKASKYRRARQDSRILSLSCMLQCVLSRLHSHDRFNQYTHQSSSCVHRINS